MNVVMSCCTSNLLIKTDRIEYFIQTSEMNTEEWSDTLLNYGSGYVPLSGTIAELEYGAS